MSVKVVCAWCNKVIREGKDENVSHGICPKCKADAEAKMAKDKKRKEGA